MVSITRIKDCTHVLGEAQGYLPLPVRRETIMTESGAINTVSMAFTLSPDEIDMLKAGEPLIVNLIGWAVPPIMFKVGDPS